jgi:hypothetical protein
MILLQPLLGLYYLSWISSGRQDLPNQWIRVQCDRRYQLLQLFRALLRRLRRLLLRTGCASRSSEPIWHAGEYQTAAKEHWHHTVLK